MNAAQHTLTFYSISEDQIDYVFRQLGHGPNVDGVVEGDTPLGHLKVRRDWDKGSGQLTVVILEKPMLLTVDSIKANIDMKLAEAAKAIADGELTATDPTLVAVIPGEVDPPASDTPQKTVSPKRAVPVVPK